MQKNNNKIPILPEKYVQGSSLEEIYALYCFDRDLRSILLKEILKFESSIKSKLSYHFSQAYKEPNAYLNMLNYSREPSKLKQILKLIAVISNEISKNSNRDNPIKHYLDNHDGVPLWVLVKYLTLGNIQNFYECTNSSIQNEIAKDFSIAYSRDYGISIHFTSDMLINILKTATLFRNVCAHEERLYNFRLYKPAKTKNISDITRIPISLLNSGNLFTMTVFLKLVISKKDYVSFVKCLKELSTRYSSKFSSVSINEVFKTMGFENGWYEDLVL